MGAIPSHESSPSLATGEAVSIQLPKAGRRSHFAETRDRIVAGSRESQISGYGSDWSTEFRSLNEIKNLPHIFVDGAKLQRALTESLAYTKFFRFQRAFCDEFIVPSGTVRETKGSLTVTYNKDPFSLSVSPCIVSPTRLYNSRDSRILSELGLVDIPGKLTTNRQRLSLLEGLSSKKVSDALKRIWDDSVPLPRAGLRLLVLRNVGVNSPLAPNLEGSFLHVHENGASDPKDTVIRNGQESHYRPAPLVVAFYDSAYGLLRRTVHERAQRSIEVQDIESATGNLKWLITWANEDGSLKKGASEESRKDAIKEIQRVIDPIISQIDDGLIHQKKRAKALLTSARDVTDERGRFNPTAALTRFQSALELLGHATNKQGRLEGFEGRDKHAVLGKIVVGERALANFRHALEATLGGSKISNNVFGDSQSNKGANGVNSEANSLFVKLFPQRQLVELKGIEVRPFLSFSKQLQGFISDFKRSIGLSLTDQSSHVDRNGAVSAFTKMFYVTRFAEAKITLDRLKLCEIGYPLRSRDDVNGKRPTVLDTPLSLINSLDKILNRKTPASDVLKLPNWEAALDKIRSAVLTARETLNDRNSTLSESEKIAAVTSLFHSNALEFLADDLEKNTPPSAIFPNWKSL